MIFKILLFTIFIFTTSLKADELKIGSVTEIIGTLIAITDELEERDLLVHDPIFINEEIFVLEGSSATIQFNDNTAIIMKELTSININEFENSKKKPKFKAELLKGKIVIESGSIAKNNNGEMIVDVTTSSLGLRGTRINVDLKPNGKSNISLAEDSFGNVGEIEVTLEGQTSNITSTEKVLEISENNETLLRKKSDNEKEELKTVSETLVKSSKIDEEEITSQLQKKLVDGKLQDANNDGVVDESDITLTKQQITDEKKQKIDFIVENSKDLNTEFLSDVIDQSDEKSTGEVIEKIIETKDNLVEGVVGNLSDKDNKFLTTSTTEAASLIKEKIFETIVAKETDKSASILSKVMSKSDIATISSVINNITEKNTNEVSKLSLKVMADFSEKNPEKLEILNQNNTDQIEKLTISAIEEAESSQEDADLIAKVVAVASDELVNKVVEEVSKNSIEKKEALSAKVIKSVIEVNPDKIENLNNEIKEIVIKQTIDAAKNQNENKDNINEDLTDIVADMIIETEIETVIIVLDNVNANNKKEGSKFAFKILNKLLDLENFEQQLEINTLTEPIFNQKIDDLIENVIDNTKSDDDIDDLVKIISKSKTIVVAEKLLVISNKDNENKNKTLKVTKKIIEEDPEKAIEIINKTKKTKIIKELIKTDIEDEDILDLEDLDEIYIENVSPN